MILMVGELATIGKTKLLIQKLYYTSSNPAYAEPDKTIFSTIYTLIIYILGR